MYNLLITIYPVCDEDQIYILTTAVQSTEALRTSTSTGRRIKYTTILTCCNFTFRTHLPRERIPENIEHCTEEDLLYGSNGPSISTSIRQKTE